MANSLLVNKLRECAVAAIQEDDLNHADSLFREMISLLTTTETNSATRKVVKYFAEALVRRLYKLYPRNPRPLVRFKDRLDYMGLNFDPFLWFANYTILDPFCKALRGKKRVHVIDFSFMVNNWQYSELMKLLAEELRGQLSFRITFVGPQLSKDVDYIEYLCLQLAFLAKSLHIDFEWRRLVANSIGEMVESTLKLSRTSEDETVVVKWEFELHKLLSPPTAINLVLAKLKDLKPEIMVIIEQEIKQNDPDLLLDCLGESFKYYSAIFESIEEDNFDRLEDHVVVWERYFRRQISKVLADDGIGQAERHETWVQWRNRLCQAGFHPVRTQFRQGPLHSDRPEYEIQGKNRLPSLCRRHYRLATTSAWKPDQTHDNLRNESVDMPEVESSLASFNIAQDARRQSGMANNFESTETEADHAPILISGNTWSAQHFSINQIAASASIFDMLEYVCHVHDLPVALTWISDRRDDTTDSSREKFKLHMEQTACFVNDAGMKGFVEACVKRCRDLEEGQGVAGKAIVSYLYFVPDVSTLDATDYPFIYDAWEFGLHAVVAIKLANIHMSDVDYILEFFLPPDEREISALKLLINGILSILKSNCTSTNIWKVLVEELAGDDIGSDAMLDEAAGTSTIIAAAEVTNTAADAPAEASFAERGISSPIPNVDNSGNCRPTLSDIDRVRSFLMNSPADNEQAADQVAAQSIHLAMFGQEFEQILAIEPVPHANLGSHKRRRRSPVWNYFDIDVRDNGEVWGKCKGCGKTYRAESTRGTSNFNRHLYSCPGIKLMRGA